MVNPSLLACRDARRCTTAITNLPDGRLSYRVNHRVGIAIIKQVAPVKYSEIA